MRSLNRQSLFSVICCLIAIGPLVPSGVYLCRHQTPPAAVNDDAALTELAVRQAAHFDRLLGSYSRWRWCHPGPALFYALLPTYQLSGEKNSGTASGSLLISLLCLIGIVRLSLRLGGPIYAATSAVLLGLFIAALNPAYAASDWAPYATILPFLLLIHVAAVLTIEGWRWLPAFALLASAIVQTHVAYVPASMYLAAVFTIPLLSRRSYPTLRITSLSIASASGMWLLPALAELRLTPGNLSKMIAFFRAQHPEHHIGEALVPVTHQLALVPVQTSRLLTGLPASPRAGIHAVVTIILIMILIAFCWRPPLARGRVLAGISLGMIAVATWSVYRIVGPIHDYLTLWISGVGILGWTIVIGSGVAMLVRRRPQACWPLAAVGVVAMAWSIRINNRQTRETPPIYERTLPEVVSLADSIQRWYARRDRDLLIRIEQNETWVTAAGVVLELVKRGLPVAVEPEWLFMFGEPMAVHGEAGGLVILRNRGSDSQTAVTKGLLRIGEGGDTIAYAMKAP